MRPLLVGEQNPYGSDPGYALYPEPERSAGGRLCRLICQMEPREYLRRFERVNLCGGAWNAKEARFTANALRTGTAEGRLIVLLGAKVCRAFERAYEPFFIESTLLGNTYLVLPHPSGLCRIWNEPGAYDRAWRALADAGAFL